ncbi:MAG: hypothetical protein SCK57_08000 [Bacillota bacterium]|nr:hypothetical protein [Bacillota bacterium]MDW7677588.1 hypothetical protein [Bacillota bacterium]
MVHAGEMIGATAEGIGSKKTVDIEAEQKKWDMFINDLEANAPPAQPLSAKRLTPFSRLPAFLLF